MRVCCTSAAADAASSTPKARGYWVTRSRNASHPAATWCAMACRMLRAQCYLTAFAPRLAASGQLCRAAQRLPRRTKELFAHWPDLIWWCLGAQGMRCTLRWTMLQAFRSPQALGSRHPVFAHQLREGCRGVTRSTAAQKSAAQHQWLSVRTARSMPSIRAADRHCGLPAADRHCGLPAHSSFSVIGEGRAG